MTVQGGLWILDGGEGGDIMKRMRNTTTGMNLGYTGKAYDAATGLYNYGYRDYAPALARFTTVDPIRDGSNWFTYVNNDPVNYVDLWGLSASDGGRAVTEYERNLYIVAAGHSIDFDNVRIYEGQLPTAKAVRDAAMSVGYSTSHISDADINRMLNPSTLEAISLPDGRIYMRDLSPDPDLTIHELNHQDTYQNGATITINGVITHLNTPSDVFGQLVIEAQLSVQGTIDPYNRKGYLEYQANEVQQKAQLIMGGAIVP